MAEETALRRKLIGKSKNNLIKMFASPKQKANLSSKGRVEAKKNESQKYDDNIKNLKSKMEFFKNWLSKE